MTHVRTQLFAIGSAASDWEPVWLWPPDGYQMDPVPVVGYNLSGEPIRQGYNTLTLTWTFMRQQHLTPLLEAYDPAQPRIRLTVIDEQVGIDRSEQDNRSPMVTYWAMMHEPVIGARQIVYYNNVAVKFTRLIRVEE